MTLEAVHTAFELDENCQGHVRRSKPERPDAAVDRMCCKPTGTLQHIALIGNYTPQRCGIATFTADTRAALAEHNDLMLIDTYAIDDGSVPNYPAEVTETIERESLPAYASAAQAMNASGADLVWLQHEFGIFGGSDGALILELVEELTVPLIVTLHTVLSEPTAAQFTIISRIAKRAGVVIVMAEHGRNLLENVYGIDPDKIAIVPHGIPDREYVEPDLVKSKLGLEGRQTILTFGLLSHDKGIEYMIDAMKTVVESNPRAMYIVLGATHPHLLAREGEKLRLNLQRRIAMLGLENHVKWIDDFVELDELTGYIRAADIYVTPYLNPMQVTSGTLSYAVGLGKPVVSTPYVHASELLNDEIGVLVPFRNSRKIALAVAQLLSQPVRRKTMARNAYLLGRTMTWDKYAEQAVALGSNILEREQNYIQPKVRSVFAFTPAG